MTPAQRRERLARELFPNYDRRVAIGRAQWYALSVIVAAGGYVAAIDHGPVSAAVLMVAGVVISFAARWR